MLPSALFDNCTLPPVNQATATIIAAVLVLAGAAVTVWQKHRADERNTWWSRVEWAVDLSLETDPARRTLGFDSLRAIGVAPAARRDYALLTTFMAREVDAVELLGDDGTNP